MLSRFSSASSRKKNPIPQWKKFKLGESFSCRSRRSCTDIRSIAPRVTRFKSLFYEHEYSPILFLGPFIANVTSPRSERGHETSLLLTSARRGANLFYSSRELGERMKGPQREYSTFLCAEGAMYVRRRQYLWKPYPCHCQNHTTYQCYLLLLSLPPLHLSKHHLHKPRNALQSPPAIQLTSRQG